MFDILNSKLTAPAGLIGLGLGGLKVVLDYYDVDIAPQLIALIGVLSAALITIGLADLLRHAHEGLIKLFQSYTFQAPLTRRQANPAPTPQARHLTQFSFEGPNFGAWDNVEKLSLAQAAHLWAEEDPSMPYLSGEYTGYLTTLQQAIEGKKLAAADGLYIQGSPHLCFVNRSDLKVYMRSIKKKPLFLFPEERQHAWMR